MTIVDTSIWIEVMRGTIKVSDDQLEEFAVCGPIIQEVLQGLDEEPKADLFREGFANVIVVGDPVARDVFAEAAELYLVGRRKGYTIRSSADCLIAAIALRQRLPVWHRDRDFEYLARFTALRTKPHSTVH